MIKVQTKVDIATVTVLGFFKVHLEAPNSDYRDRENAYWDILNKHIHYLATKNGRSSEFELK